jgi:hypothetical protein
MLKYRFLFLSHFPPGSCASFFSEEKLDVLQLETSSGELLSRPQKGKL